ncbi:energy transducer TonB [Luteimonas sp. 3794]|uniref:energy transducer TonB n=1 Tax=Luteimonas sp. 3794 TaxID=2817730 RepID=UPI00286034AD|nr:energy transducer TonB [Luteimonas sp. 3794]MDR6990749.1 TonB family protein [Luteimonas sp. 3794]
MPASPPPLSVRLRRTLREALPSGRAWWFVIGGCAAGVLLFALLWLARSSTGTSRDGENMPTMPDDQAMAPLPAPLPAAGSTDRGFDYASPQDTRTPVRIDAHVPQTASPAPVAAPNDQMPAPQATTAATDLPTSVPRPVSTQQPEYPRASMRRGERGEVLLLVKVGADGRVDGVDVVSSSQHRRLDRAAVAAVRRWRFEPALRDGRPVAGELRIPFSFAPEGG